MSQLYPKCLLRVAVAVTFLLPFTHISAQTCELDNPTMVSLPSITEASIKAKLTQFTPEYNAADLKKLKDQLAKCNSDVEAQLLAIEQNISNASLKYQEFLAVKDFGSLEKQIKDLEASRALSAKELENNLASTKHSGVFIVLLQNINPYTNKNDLIKQAQDALAPQAVSSLNGTQIKRLTEVKDLMEVKDIIESFSGGEMTPAEILADKQIFTKKIFFYAAKVSVSPLKNKEMAIPQGGSGTDIIIIDALNESDYQQTLRQYGIPEDQINDLTARIAAKAQGVNTENDQADRNQINIAQRGEEQIKKIDNQIEELRSKVDGNKARVKEALITLGAPYDENDVVGSIENGIKAQFGVIEQLRQDWNTVKAQEYQWKDVLVEISGDPFPALAAEALRLSKSLNQTYGVVKKSTELVRVEDMIVKDVQNSTATQTFREVERLWIYPIPQDDGTFKLTVVVRFKINNKIGNVVEPAVALNPMDIDIQRGLEAFGAKNYNDAYRVFLKYSKNLNAECSFAMGYMFHYGKGVKQDDNEAFKWAQKSAKAKNPNGQWLLGLLYEDGKGVTADYSEAFRLYSLSAEQGNSGGQYNLGSMYYNGRQVTVNYPEAVRWFKLSANQGDAEGQIWLAIAYAAGNGVKQDLAESFKWYKKAAEQDNLIAIREVASCYYSGNGVVMDPKESLKWFRKAAELGDPIGQSSVAYMYANGVGVERDSLEALSWYRKAAEQGDAASQTIVGLMYENGKDYAEALKWYRKSAAQNNSGGQYNLGSLYYNGYGVIKNYQEAVKWFKLSSDSGDPEGINWLATAYYNGNGVAKDIDKAIQLYREAADKGSQYAKDTLISLGYGN